MSVPGTYEQRLLQKCEDVLHAAERRVGPGSRLAVLEAAAGQVGGWSLRAFRDCFGETADDQQLAPFASTLVQRLHETPIPVALAIASLGRAPRARHAQRTAGAFYTDFRLARYVTEAFEPEAPGALILDPAAGSGILLAAAVIGAGRNDPSRMTELVATSVCASDLDGDALRACRAALASLCVDVDAIAEGATRLRKLDSLLAGPTAWNDVAPEGFDFVVGNPPWEKVKVSRHEFLVAQGHRRHYGAAYEEPLDELALNGERAKTAEYARQVAALYPSAAEGELDLYKAFVACSIMLLRPRGHFGVIVPAGLIRSQGTERLRRHLLEQCGAVEATVVDNRAKFFAIDTRFKFLVVRARKDGPRRPLRILHAVGDDEQVVVTDRARVGRTDLGRTRPDLTVPEVRSNGEWEIVRHMHATGWRIGDGDSPFGCTIVREVDMTRDRARFAAGGGDGLLPLAEGRMVGQHRFGAKAYQSGTGRRAVWERLPPGLSAVEPQFFYPFDDLPPAVRDRVGVMRVGFCDVTGQTNERSIIAALVPAGVVCGNKVPTIVFDGDTDGHLARLFVAIANSIAFDWMARRVITTSVNYFVLRSLPLPRVEPRSTEADRLAELAERCAQRDAIKRPLTFQEKWELAEWRGELDARVLAAWHLAGDHLRLMLRDFSLLDRGQPPLPGEKRSTVTADLALAWRARIEGKADEAAERRANMARRAGACAYVASEFALEEGAYGRTVDVDTRTHRVAPSRRR